MILATKFLQAPCLILACTALSGCLGSSSSGSGGGGAGGGGSMTPTEFEAAFHRTGGMGPTTDMPIAGTADFAGATLVDLHHGSTKVGELMGDIEMTVDFAAANDAARQNDALSGKVTNIRGKIGQEDVTFDGQLTTADAKTKSLPSTVRTATTTIDAPIIGPTTTRTGSMMAHFSGDLKVGDDEGSAVLQLGGSFTGPGAKGVTGAATGTWFDPSNPESFTVGGKFYADRK